MLVTFSICLYPSCSLLCRLGIAAVSEVRLVFFIDFCRAGMPGLAPAGEALFFASPKKSTQKKGEPNASPGTLCRYAVLLGPGGVSLELGFASNNREP
jgi:hypothetical protein